MKITRSNSSQIDQTDSSGCESFWAWTKSRRQAALLQKSVKPTTDSSPPIHRWDPDAPDSLSPQGGRLSLSLSEHFLFSRPLHGLFIKWGAHPALKRRAIFIQSASRTAAKTTFAAKPRQARFYFTFVTAIVVCLFTLACSGKTAPANAPGSTNTTSRGNSSSPTTNNSSSNSTNENYPTLATQAKEVSDALARKDYNRVADLTYPKAVELSGGREKMISSMTTEVNKMTEQGVTLLSTTLNAPTQFIHDSGSIYAVIPVSLHVKAKDGTFQSDGTMIGISTDGGANWTFIDASGKDQTELRTLLPNVIDKLTLPPPKPPVKISNS